MMKRLILMIYITLRSFFSYEYIGTTSAIDPYAQSGRQPRSSIEDDMTMHDDTGMRSDIKGKNTNVYIILLIHDINYILTIVFLRPLQLFFAF